MKRVSLDLETFSSTDLTKTGVYRYVEDPTFEVLLAAWAVEDGPVKLLDYKNIDPALEAEFVEMLLDPEYEKHAHNAAFEIVCLSRQYREIELDLSQWRCDMVAGQMLGLPAKLSELALALELPAEQQKLTTGRSLISFFCGPCKPTKANSGRARNLPEHDPEKWGLFKAYCMRDVETERAAHAALDGIPEKFFTEQHRLWREVDQPVNSRGVRVDMDLVHAAIEMYEEHEKRCLARAVELSGLKNPNSLTQLKKWLLAETGDIVESLNKNNLPAYIASAPNGVVAEVLQLRQQLSLSSIKKYEAVARSVCRDGRVRGLFSFYGANRTGRWSGRLVQMQNLKKNPPGFDIELARKLIKARDLDTITFLWGDLSVVLSECIRSVFVPRPGYKILSVDYSAVEARGLAWAAWEEWRMEVFRTHGRLYEASASAMFNIPLEQITKKHPKRAAGKVAELALGFQGAVDAMIRMKALEMGLLEEELLPIVQAWRKASPAIASQSWQEPGFWAKMEAAAVGCLTTDTPWAVEIGDPADRRKVWFKTVTNNSYKWMVMILPSGRGLFYFSPQIEEVKRYGKVKKQVSYMGNGDTGKWTRIRTYGGKLTENFDQAFCRDLLAESMDSLKSQDIIAHVHDEVNIEVPEAQALEAEALLLDVFSRTPKWAVGLPLRGDVDVLDFYRKVED